MSAGFFYDRYWASNFFDDRFWSFEDEPAEGTLKAGVYHPAFWARDFFDDRYWLSVPGSEAAGALNGGTLAGLTGVMLGTMRVAGQKTGQLHTTLEGVTGSAEAQVASGVDFELNVNIGVNWQLVDTPALSAGLDATLEDLAAEFVGSTQVLGQINGAIASTLDDLTGAAAGSVLNPGAFVATLETTLEDLAPALTGYFIAEANFNATIRVTLEGLAADLAGENVRPLFTGHIPAGRPMQDLTGRINAAFIPAGAWIGQLHTGLAGITGALAGEYSVPGRTGAAAATLDDLAMVAGGLFVPEGGKLGQFTGLVGGIAAYLGGYVITPTQAASALQPVTSTSIDWKTLTDQYNAGAEETPDYEFSGGRKFYQEAS